MILYDRHYLLRLFRRQFQLIQDHLHAFRTRVDMIACIMTVPFADIVE